MTEQEKDWRRDNKEWIDLNDLSAFAWPIIKTIYTIGLEVERLKYHTARQELRINDLERIINER